MGVLFGEEGGDGCGVADVGFDEAVAWVGGDVGEACEVSGVGECVEVDDAQGFGGWGGGGWGSCGRSVSVAKKHADEVAADESGAAGDEPCSHDGG